MPDPKLWKSPDLVPTLHYRDLPNAVAFLERVFQFRERIEARLSWCGGERGESWFEWPGGGRAFLELGGALISITCAMQDDQAPTPGLVLKIYVDDVEAHFAHAKSEFARIVVELRDGFWGGRFYRVLDLEDHIWEFSQRGRDLAPDQWKIPPGHRVGKL